MVAELRVRKGGCSPDDKRLSSSFSNPCDGSRLALEEYIWQRGSQSGRTILVAAKKPNPGKQNTKKIAMIGASTKLESS